VKEGCIPQDWKSSMVLWFYQFTKGKGIQWSVDLTEECYESGERFFENRIRQQIDIDDMQFGFMKGKGTTDAVFIVRQLQDKFRAKGKKLYFGFVDFEKASDRVLREVIRWAMCKFGVEE